MCTQRKDKQEGFSLVELLVVVAILAILAAIAIPLFLNQKVKAKSATAASDAHNFVLNAESAHNSYAQGATLPVAFSTEAFSNFTGTPGGAITLYRDCALNGSDQLRTSQGNYVVRAYRGTTYSEAVATYYMYDSLTSTWRKNVGAGGTITAYDNSTTVATPTNECTVSYTHQSY